MHDLLAGAKDGPRHAGLRRLAASHLVRRIGDNLPRGERCAARADRGAHPGEDLIAPGGEICCLVSGGADSTCLWHALTGSATASPRVHVNHRLRGEESEEDARFCREALGAEVVELDGAG